MAPRKYKKPFTGRGTTHPTGVAYSTPPDSPVLMSRGLAAVIAFTEYCGNCVCSLSVCLFVCLPVPISQELHVQISLKFPRLLPMCLVLQAALQFTVYFRFCR